MNELLFFAGLRENLGKEKVQMDAEGLTIAQIKEKIRSEYNVEQVDVCMIAINEEFAPDEAKIEKGDTIAFIPPVSGG